MLMTLPPHREARSYFLHCPLDLYSVDEVAELALMSMRNRVSMTHISVDVCRLISMRNDPYLTKSIVDSDLATIAERRIVSGCRLLGIPAVESFSESDLMIKLMELCEEFGCRPYFLGEERYVLDSFLDEIQEKYPELEIAGYHDGSFSTGHEQLIIDDIDRAHADCLIVGRLSVGRERFIGKYRSQLGSPFLMNAGLAIEKIGLQSRHHESYEPQDFFGWISDHFKRQVCFLKRRLYPGTMFVLLVGREFMRRIASFFAKKRTAFL